MKKIAFPVVVFAIVASAFAAATKMGRDRDAARAQNAVLAERLARAEAVSSAVLKIDELYRQEKAENAALAARLAIAESAASSRAEMKDAVADRPKTKKRKAAVTTPLPGYAR